jgi:hypothetical protein
LWLNADDEDSVSKYRRMSKFRHCKSTLVEIPSRIVFAEKCFFSQLIPHVSVDVDSDPGVSTRRLAGARSEQRLHLCDELRDAVLGVAEQHHALLVVVEVVVDAGEGTFTTMSAGRRGRLRPA